MKSLQHVNVYTVEEAVNTLREFQGEAMVIAGGTDITGVLKDKLLPDYPKALVNIKTIPALSYIKEESSGIKIGSLATLSELSKSPLLQGQYKVLAKAACNVATPQIRNMGTIGGNLGQDTRCWYYRYPHSLGGRIMCLRKGNGPCLAVAGDNRYHSVFGGQGCFASCPSDTAVALLALNAEVKVTGKWGTRTIPVQEFFHPRGNSLKKVELIQEIQMPYLAEKTRGCFLKYTLRKPVDFAIVSVAVLVAMEEGVCSEARIVLGAVAPGPLRAKKAEDFLKGKLIDATVLEEAGHLAVSGAKPLSMNSYKVEIARTLVVRALTDCAFD